jgi:Family of unknown function (DUF6186)
MAATLPWVLGWSAVVVVLALWEVAGARFGYPRLADASAALARHRAVRIVLFGFWLWLGWHFFIRGWRFFLQQP